MFYLLQWPYVVHWSHNNNNGGCRWSRCPIVTRTNWLRKFAQTGQKRLSIIAVHYARGANARHTCHDYHVTIVCATCACEVGQLCHDANGSRGNSPAAGFTCHACCLQPPSASTLQGAMVPTNCRSPAHLSVRLVSRAVLLPSRTAAALSRGYSSISVDALLVFGWPCLRDTACNLYPVKLRRPVGCPPLKRR